MKANDSLQSEPIRSSSLAELLHVSQQAINLYFQLVQDAGSITKSQILENQGLSSKQAEQYLTELQACGLVRRNPDDTLEAIMPIEALMLALTGIRNLLRELRKDFPKKVSNGIPSINNTVQSRLDTLPSQLEKIQNAVNKTLDKVLNDFHSKAMNLQSFPTFETFADNIQSKLLEEVDTQMMEVRNRLNEFESIEALTNVLSKLKNDVFDIVNISLSDMREKAFRLHELETFRETLIELWNITPSIVEEHLTTFEQEMSTLEASLGDLMETKYRLGAFKGVIENFAKEHIMTAVRKLKANFQISLTEAIQDHLKQVQERFEEVSRAAYHEFDKLREQLAEWVRNALDLAFSEVIQRNQRAASDLALRLEELTLVFRDRFASGLYDSVKQVKLQAHELDKHLNRIPEQLSLLREKEIAPQVDFLMKQSEIELGKITHDLPKAFVDWRMNYLQTVNTQMTSLLEKTEGHLNLATQSLNQFWRRSKETEATTFDLYQFVIGETEFQSYVASLIARSRKHLYLILPRSIKVKLKLLNMIPSDVHVRIVAADNPDSKLVKSLEKVAIKNPNFQLRHDPRGDVWGVVRDFEEIIIGNTSKGTTNIVGIASSHEDHVELLRSIMETRWLHAKSLP